jgi:hypothetical protein
MDFEPLLSPESGAAVRAYDTGPGVFARMFTRWMDGNQWAHHVMVTLATASVGKAWLHSSQISGFRHGKVSNPGPRAFAAIERLNYYVWRYHHTKQLIPGTKSSNAYAQAVPITEDDIPPSAGWFLEVFLGYRVPRDFDTGALSIPEYEAQNCSLALARLFRRLISAQGYDLLEDLDRALLDHYGIREAERVQRLHDVLLSRCSYTSDQLSLELPALTHFAAALGGPITESELLREIRSTP